MFMYPVLEIHVCIPLSCHVGGFQVLDLLHYATLEQSQHCKVIEYDSPP